MPEVISKTSGRGFWSTVKEKKLEPVPQEQFFMFFRSCLITDWGGGQMSVRREKERR